MTDTWPGRRAWAHGTHGEIIEQLDHPGLLQESAEQDEQKNVGDDT